MAPICGQRMLVAVLGVGALGSALVGCVLSSAGISGSEASATSASSSASSTSSTASGAGGGASASSGSTGGMGGSGGTGGSSGDPCGPGSTAEIQDDFTDPVRKAEWTPFSNDAATTAVEANNELLIVTGGVLSAQAGYYWNGAARSLVGCHASIEVKQAPPQNLGLLTLFELLDDADPTNVGTLSIGLLNNTLKFGHRLGATIIGTSEAPYVPSAHRFWRFHESKGTVHFEVSADGESWQSAYSTPTPSFVSKVRVRLSILAVAAAFPGGTAILDNLNIDPP